MCFISLLYQCYICILFLIVVLFNILFSYKWCVKCNLLNHIISLETRNPTWAYNHTGICVYKSILTYTHKTHIYIYNYICGYWYICGYEYQRVSIILFIFSVSTQLEDRISSSFFPPFSPVSLFFSLPSFFSLFPPPFFLSSSSFPSPLFLPFFATTSSFFPLFWKLSWPLFHIWILESTSTYLTSLVAQTVKRLPTMQETWVRSVDREDPLEKEMATHASTLAWKIP